MLWSFLNKSSPYWCCATTYYFNSHYPTWIYPNVSQVEYILMREHAVFLLVCIRSLWSTVPCSKWTGIRQFMWRKIHIKTCKQSQHLSLLARIWALYQATDLSVPQWAARRAVNLFHDLLRSLLAHFPVLWCVLTDSVEVQFLSDFLMVL